MATSAKLQSHPTRSYDYHAMARRWSEEIWNQRREATIDEMMHPDCVVEVEGQDAPITREQFKAYRRAFLSAIPDLHVDILALTFEGSNGFMTWRVQGTHTGPGLGIPPSGKTVDVNGFSNFVYDEGLIVRGVDRWNRGEMIASLMQVRMDELCAAKGLTAREAQVSLMMADRMTHQEIAEALHISPNTARRHCERVLSKLGVSRRQEVAKALGKIPGTVLARQGEDLPG